MAKSAPVPGDPNETSLPFSPFSKFVLGGTAVVVLIAGLIRARHGGAWDNFDSTTLLYLSVPAALALVSNAKSLKVGSGGIEWERLERRVENVAARLQTTEQTVEATQLAVASGVGKKESQPHKAVASGQHQMHSANDDPLAAEYAGRTRDNGRVISAQVSRVPGVTDWFRITARVSPDVDAPPLAGPVVFLLHPTFTNPRQVVQPGPNGSARLELVAWGAFTLGAEADNGATRLGIDLSKLTSAPAEFRSR